LVLCLIFYKHILFRKLNYIINIFDVAISPDNNYVYMVADKHLYVVNVMDKSNPFVYSDNYIPQAGTMSSVKVRKIHTAIDAGGNPLGFQNLLLVTDYTKGLHIFDLDDYQAPLLKKTVETDQDGQWYQAYKCEILQKDTVYPDNNTSVDTAVYVAANQQGLITVDVDENNLTASTAVDSKMWTNGHAYDVTTLKYGESNFIFIASGAEGINVYHDDSEDIFHPDFLKKFEHPNNASVYSVDPYLDTYIVAASNDNGTWIWNPDIGNEFILATGTETVDVAVNKEKNIAASLNGHNEGVSFINLAPLAE
jgi:WD40 repeat protein